MSFYRFNNIIYSFITNPHTGKLTNIHSGIGKNPTKLFNTNDWWRVT